MSDYAWIVTRDCLEEKDIKILGGSDITDEQEKRLVAGEGEKFIMRDCDNIDYYKGRIIGDYTGFEPLEDYGTPNAGATDILYKNKDTRVWEVL